MNVSVVGKTVAERLKRARMHFEKAQSSVDKAKLNVGGWTSCFEEVCEGRTEEGRKFLKEAEKELKEAIKILEKEVGQFSLRLPEWAKCELSNLREKSKNLAEDLEFAYDLCIKSRDCKRTSECYTLAELCDKSLKKLYQRIGRMWFDIDYISHWLEEGKTPP